uniref:Uncharacterized protein n=1 Tax=Romanomermis culicivorax TaxID=13658 RepID=A0A915IQL3_ROMCU
MLQHSTHDVVANPRVPNPIFLLSRGRDGHTYPDIGQCWDSFGATQEALQQDYPKRARCRDIPGSSCRVALTFFHIFFMSKANKYKSFGSKAKSPMRLETHDSKSTLMLGKPSKENSNRFGPEHFVASISAPAISASGRFGAGHFGA